MYKLYILVFNLININLD